MHKSRLHLALEATLEPLAPEAAVTYFRGLVPTLGTNPQRFGADQRRQAFTLAAATETELLARVQKAIGDALAGGESGRTTTGKIEDILDAAGVGRGGAYAEMVVRTNAMDALNQGIEDEAASPDIQEMFPVWEYMNPDDSRSRPEHAENNGKFFPADVTLDDVRGREIGDKANCRCVKRLVSLMEWQRLRAAGKKIATGYADPLDARPAPPPRPRVAAAAKEKTRPAAPAAMAPQRLPVQPMPAEIGANASADPRSLLRVQLPPAVWDAREVVIQAIVRHARASQGFGRLTIPELHAVVQRAGSLNLSIQQLHALLAQLHQTGAIRLGPYTQAISTIPAPQYALPLDREFKYYVSLS